MFPHYETALLAGGDPDLLLLRSAMLASVGIWSVRVRNASQALQILDMVPCDLAVICYTFDQADEKRLLDALRYRHGAVKILHVVPGDDCSGSGFLHNVEEALNAPAALPNAALEPSQASSRMIR
jgi:hypothetical protein